MPEDGTKGLGTLADTFRKVPAVPMRMPEVGEVFAGRYDIKRMIGRGGMGVVYLATQAPLGRQVALKILKPPESLEDDPNFDERFLREAAAAARLSHPNTITVHDFGQADDGALYIVMEYLEGNDVRTVIAHEGAFHPGRAIHVAKQVAKSLREAHRKGIIHRDLKPANVLLVNRDEDADFVKVLDFGLVKFRGEASEITLAGKFLGSPRYTSPEALDRTREVDHRADIYAVGILLYAMITGHPPFDGDPMQVLHAHLHEKPKPMWKLNPAAQTSPALEALVARCLEKDPDLRFQSMGDLVNALRNAGGAFGADDTETLDLEVNESLELDPEPGTPLPRRPSKPLPTPTVAPAPRQPSPGPAAREPKKRRRRRGGMSTGLKALIGVAALLAIAVVGLLVTQGDGDEDPAGASDSEPTDGAVEIEVAPTKLAIGSTPAGATVEAEIDGAWTPLGATPLTAAEVSLPEGATELRVRLRREGYEKLVTTVPVADGAANWTGELVATPAATPEPTPKVTPAPTPKPKPAPVAKPKPTPEPAPAAKPKPKPKPKPEAKPDPTPSSPSGYKDNPY